MSRPQIVLPGAGHPFSTFVEKVGVVLKRCLASKEVPRDVELRDRHRAGNTFDASDTTQCFLCFRHNVFGRIRKDYKTGMSTKSIFFEPISPDAAVTVLEQWIEFIVYTKEGECPRSMSPAQAKTLMEAPRLKDFLPRVDRIFEFSIPCKLFRPTPGTPPVAPSLDLDSITHTHGGDKPQHSGNGSSGTGNQILDKGTQEKQENTLDVCHQIHESFLAHNSVCFQMLVAAADGTETYQTTTDPSRLTKLALFKLEPGFGFYQQDNGERIYYYCDRFQDFHVSFKEARELIDTMLEEFPLDEQSKTNAIARLLTPYCQGLMGWRKRSPLVILTANQPRSGKDYLAMLAPLIHSHFATQDPPLEDDSEVKRRITAALISGRRFMHFANCRGNIDNPSLEAAVTCEYWTDRIIRSSNEETVANEIMFSMSFNGNLPMTRDIAGRVSIIRLNSERKNLNDHEYKTDLHGQLSRLAPPEEFSVLTTYLCRRNVLAALDALTMHWLQKGAHYGSAFTSYPEWARIVGGIVKYADYGDPCKTDEVASVVGALDDWERDVIELGKMTDPKKSYKSRELTNQFIVTKADAFPAFQDYISEDSIPVFNSELSQYLNSRLGLPLTVGSDTCVVYRVVRTRVPRFCFKARSSGVASSTAPILVPATPTGYPMTPELGNLSHYGRNPGENGDPLVPTSLKEN